MIYSGIKRAINYLVNMQTVFTSNFGKDSFFFTISLVALCKWELVQWGIYLQLENILAYALGANWVLWQCSAWLVHIHTRLENSISQKVQSTLKKNGPGLKSLSWLCDFVSGCVGIFFSLLCCVLLFYWPTDSNTVDGNTVACQK